jgi:hypothetical protein
MDKGNDGRGKDGLSETKLLVRKGTNEYVREGKVYIKSRLFGKGLNKDKLREGI